MLNPAKLLLFTLIW